MPTIINLFMQYVCSKHPSQELIVVQPSNQACQVQPCAICERENSTRYVELKHDFLNLQERLEKAEKPKTRKNKRGEYLKGGKK